MRRGGRWALEMLAVWIAALELCHWASCALSEPHRRPASAKPSSHLLSDLSFLPPHSSSITSSFKRHARPLKTRRLIAVTSSPRLRLSTTAFAERRPPPQKRGIFDSSRKVFSSRHIRATPPRWSSKSCIPSLAASCVFEAAPALSPPVAGRCGAIQPMRHLLTIRSQLHRRGGTSKTASAKANGILT